MNREGAKFPQAVGQSRRQRGFPHSVPDTESVSLVGTTGFAVGNLFLEYNQNDGTRVKTDGEELLRELCEEQLRELLKDDV